MTKDNTLNVDPYVASSLLQKAIRRGDADMAAKAAHTLYRQRRKAIWRRFIGIAFEDVVAANPILVTRVTETALAARQANDQARWPAIISDFCRDLAASPKSRSTDHLFWSAGAWAATNGHSFDFNRQCCGELIAVAGDPDRELVERAAAMLMHNPNGPRRTLSDQGQALRTLAGFLSAPASEMADVSLNAFALIKHPFVLLLPLIISAMKQEGVEPVLVEPDIPIPAYAGGVPLYAFDKHTSTGKAAIKLFAQRSASVIAVLAQHVASDARGAVACMAAFYADAAPVAWKLEWAGGAEIERAGFEADMLKVGCPPASADAVLEAVIAELPLLNDVRSELLGKRAGR